MCSNRDKLRTIYKLYIYAFPGTNQRWLQSFTNLRFPPWLVTGPPRHPSPPICAIAASGPPFKTRRREEGPRRQCYQEIKDRLMCGGLLYLVVKLSVKVIHNIVSRNSDGQ